MRLGGVVICCGLVLAIAGCKRSSSKQARVLAVDDAGTTVEPPDQRPEMIVLERVELETLGPSAEVERGERAMALDFARHLVDSGLFVAQADHVPATHRPRAAHLELQISYDVLTHESGARAIMAAAQARLVWADGGDDAWICPISRTRVPRRRTWPVSSGVNWTGRNPLGGSTRFACTRMKTCMPK
jgi:hypothetical protein